MGKLIYKFPFQLIQGDCLEEMKRIPDKSIDMILADLPYGTTACKWDVIIPFEPLWIQYKRIIKDNSAIVLFGSEPFSTLLRTSNFDNYKYDWIWCKNRPGGISVAKYQPMRAVETLSVFNSKFYYPIMLKRDKKELSRISKNSLTHTKSFYGNKIYIQKREDREYKYPNNILNFDCVHSRDKQKTIHPTQKPVALCEYLIKTYTQENEIVLDNVMGSGTTGIACINTNRKFIGIEKDKEYFRLAKQRLYIHYYRKIPRIHYYIINECMKNRISSLFRKTYLDKLIRREKSNG